MKVRRVKYRYCEHLIPDYDETMQKIEVCKATILERDDMCANCAYETKEMKEATKDNKTMKSFMTPLFEVKIYE